MSGPHPGVLNCASCGAAPPQADPWLYLRRVNSKRHAPIFLCPECDVVRTPPQPQARPEWDYNPPAADTADRVVHDDMKRTMQRIAAVLAEAMPPGCGFTLFVFQYGPGGWLTYLSSAERGDTRQMLAEWLANTPAVQPGA